VAVLIRAVARHPVLAFMVISLGVYFLVALVLAPGCPEFSSLVSNTNTRAARTRTGTHEGQGA
jgi:hypothetical protein